MSSETIPEWAMEEADEVWTALANNEANGREGETALFALALLAAEQRGRKAGLEEAAKVAFDEMFEAVDAIRALKLQTAIRSLGEKT